MAVQTTLWQQQSLVVAPKIRHGLKRIDRFFAKMILDIEL